MPQIIIASCWSIAVALCLPALAPNLVGGNESVKLSVGYSTSRVTALISRATGPVVFGHFFADVIVEPAIKLQFSPFRSNALRINGDNRAFLERFVIVEPVFQVSDWSKA